MGFLNGQYVPFVRLKVTSKKSSILRFVLISVLNSASFKIFLTFFLTQSRFCLLTLHNNAKPSLWYKPELLLSIMFAKGNNRYIPSLLILKFLCHRNSPLSHQKSSQCFFFQDSLLFYKSGLQQCLIIVKFLPDISVWCLAKLIAVSKILSVILG